MEMMAPSGRFCRAMPRLSARAEAKEMVSLPLSHPATTTPTAIPSGRLCRATAKTIMVDLPRLHCVPSGQSLPTCRWGISLSKPSRNRKPAHTPMKLGKNASFPMCSDCSIAGMIKLHTEAATITPAAKPMSSRCRFRFILSFKKNTQAAPSTVPKNGMNIALADSKNIIKTPCFLCAFILKCISQLFRDKVTVRAVKFRYTCDTINHLKENIS